LKKDRIELKIKECIKNLERKNKTFSEMSKNKKTDMCDEYY
jgi:hypothetical protein